MKGKLSIIRVLLILGAATLSGCGSPADPNAEETGLANPASVYCEEQGGTLEIRTGADGGQYGVCIFSDGSECEEWAFHRGECAPGGQPESDIAQFVISARDAALAWVRDQYSDTAPTTDLVWTGERTSGDLPGWSEYQFSAGEWTVTIGHAVVPPEQMIYQVSLSSQSTGLLWEGEVDPAGQVSDASNPAPEPVAGPNPAAARDAAMTYVSQEYRIWSTDTPPPELNWLEEEATEAGLIGSTALRYTVDNWVVTVSFPMVAPDATIYSVFIENSSTGFRWEGEVDATGQVTEIASPPSGVQVVAWYGHIISTPDGAQFDDYLVLMPEGTGEIGVEGVDEGIKAEIAALRDAQEPGKYAHFWGVLLCDVLDVGGCQLLVTRLRVDGPGFFFDPDPVDGWEGTIASAPSDEPRSGGDDYLVRSNDFSIQYGIGSTDAEIAAQLESLRDTGATVQIWGEISAGVIDWNGTQIQVTRIELME